jgi:hypothetical protein
MVASSQRCQALEHSTAAALMPRQREPRYELLGSWPFCDLHCYATMDGEADTKLMC